MDRRRFLVQATTGAVCSLMAGHGLAGAEQGYLPASLSISAQGAGRNIPESYTGLSYELAQLSESDFFSAAHSDPIALFRRLSPRGLLRLGGNTSEFCWLQVEPSTEAPKLHVPPGNLNTNWMPHRLFAISPRAITNLADFLHATG